MFLFVCLLYPEESQMGGILLLRHRSEMGPLFFVMCMITIDAMTNQNSCTVIH